MSLLGTSLTAAMATPTAQAAANCNDSFKISTVPTMFDGATFETIFLTAKVATIEVETFAQWRPDESGSDPASLVLHHSTLKGVRVQFCALVPPDVPNNAELWKKYQNEVITLVGEGTVASDQLDTTDATGGIRVLGWDTREARFTRRTPTGDVLAIQHHFVLTQGNAGLRVILTAPQPVFEQALDDLRYWFSRLKISQPES